MSKEPLGRLAWRCRRGMRELDVVLMRYLQHEFASAEATQKKAFLDLLDCEDPEIFGYLTGRFAPADAETQRLIESLQR